MAALKQGGVKIQLVITLATPHGRPPVIFDRQMINFYDNLQKSSELSDSTVINLSGGYNDLLVAPHLSYTSSFDNSHAVVSTFCILRYKEL